MTRSADDPGPIDSPSAPPPGYAPGGNLVITLAVEGARRTILDVLAAGSVAVVGSDEAVRGLLGRAAAELAPTLEGGGGRLLLVGWERAGGAPGPEKASGLSSCQAAASLLAATPEGTPVVVLVEPTLAASEPAGVDRLVAAATGRDGSAVVVGGRYGGCAETVELAGLPSGAGAVARGAAALAVGQGTPRRQGAPTGQGSDGLDVETTATALGARVDLLGAVSVDGAAAGLTGHPKLTELAVYLALHEGGAPSRVWAEALWPERAVPPQTIANRLSELRRLLGFAPDGRPRLRREGDRHRLVDVRTDWATARQLASPEGGPEAWGEALALVRGRPFTGLRDGGWTQVEGHLAEVERVLTDCALRASAALLEGDRPDEAAWAAEQGLRAVPWDERLHRALMRAGAAAGNLGRVEATLRHLALALELDGDPLGQVHPETARLYRELSGRGR